MARLEHVSDVPYGELRIYFRQGARHRGKGLFGALGSKSEYEAVLEAAKAHGIPFGKAKHSHMGFAEGEAIHRASASCPTPCSRSTWSSWPSAKC